MLGLGETLDLRRGLLRAVISLRSLEDYYRPIVFSVAGQTTPRDNHIGASQQRFRFAPHGCVPRCSLDSQVSSVCWFRFLVARHCFVEFVGWEGGRI